MSSSINCQLYDKETKKVVNYIFATNKSEVETWNESSLNVMSILF